MSGAPTIATRTARRRPGQSANVADDLLQHALRGASAAALIVLLGACARPVGDFGRAEPDVIHDDLMPAAGASRAR